MFNQIAIAQKFGILEASITRIEEWSNCVFVVMSKIGARFVSKKVAVMPFQPISEPILKPMLADHTLDGNLDKLDEIEFPKLVLPKYDGIRIRMDNGIIKSRTDKAIPNSWLQSQLAILPTGFEGEIVVNNSFPETQSCVMSKAKKNFSYQVFLFDNCIHSGGYQDRLQSLSSGYHHPQVQVAESVLVNSKAELLAMEAHYVNQGYEGIIIRDPEASHKEGHTSFTSQAYLSCKRYATTEGKIVDFKCKLEDGQPVATLGAVILNKDGIEFSIGSGMTDAIRDYWWANRHKLIGKTVEYKYQPSSQQSPRFPVFLRIREV